MTKESNIQSTTVEKNFLPSTVKEAFPALFKIAVPVMLGSAIETLYNLTDAFFLGKLGTAEISAPSIAFNIVFFLNVFGIGLSGAGTTLIAQSKGKMDNAKMNHYLNQLASLLIIVSVVIAIIGNLISSPILKLLGTPSDVFPFAKSYMCIAFLGTPFMFMYLVLQASFTAIGNTITPIIIHLFAVLFNVVLDPLLIYGIGPIPAMSVSGAAYATVISQGIGAILSIIVLLKGKSGLKLTKACFKPDTKAWKLLFKIGLPASFGQGLSAFGFTVLQGIVNSFGTSAIAAFGVGNRLMNMFDIPVHGIANGTTSFVGRAMGAKNEKSANTVIKTALLMVIVFEVPLLTLSIIYGGDLVRFFVSDLESIALGKVMFQVVSPSLLAFGLFFALTGAFQGAGDTKIIMYLSIFRLWGVRVPLAYLLSAKTNLGPIIIWIAMFVSNFLTALIGAIYYKKGKWRKALDSDKI